MLRDDTTYRAARLLTMRFCKAQRCGFRADFTDGARAALLGIKYNGNLRPPAYQTQYRKGYEAGLRTLPVTG